jgi:hypothetical protein
MGAGAEAFTVARSTLQGRMKGHEMYLPFSIDLIANRRRPPVQPIFELFESELAALLMFNAANSLSKSSKIG